LLLLLLLVPCYCIHYVVSSLSRTVHAADGRGGGVAQGDDARGSQGVVVPVAMSTHPFPVCKALWGLLKRLSPVMSQHERCMFNLDLLPQVAFLLPSPLPPQCVPEVRRVRVRIRVGASADGGSAFIFNPFEKKKAKKKGGVEGAVSVAAFRQHRVQRQCAAATVLQAVDGTGVARLPEFVPLPSDASVVYVSGARAVVHVGLRNPLPISMRVGVSVVVQVGDGATSLVEGSSYAFGVPPGCILGDEIVTSVPGGATNAVVSSWLRCGARPHLTAAEVRVAAVAIVVRDVGCL
jgi:hypothetical protein